ncbi:cytochrome P450 [Rhizopogon salebrosus TDB-379]|nr:cytochrome P450 [Rhizopogon salebrosus TDB-379]
MLDAGPAFYFATLAFVLVGLSWLRKYRANHSHLPLPPGPPSLPIVGSILSFDDPTRPWQSFNAWKSTYGDIIYARLFNTPVIVVNSEEVAKDLFESRSAIYSDKSQSIVYKHFAADFTAGLMPYGKRWRIQRRILHQSFGQAAIPTYHPRLLRGARKMLFRFLQNPTDYTSNFKMFPPSCMLPIVYDRELEGKDDYVFHAVQRYLELVNAGLAPVSTAIMETFPFLLRLPTWFPGATFKRASVECLRAGHGVKEVTFKDVKERMASHGTTASCLVVDNLKSMKGFEDDVFATTVKEAAFTAYAVFILPFSQTISTLLMFFFAMALHPEVQAKAQADIDRVVGKDRLPDFSDRAALPYLDAITRETHRWHPVFPMSIPHSTTTSDMYKGYFIPKGVVVIANTWAITHDEKKYPCPDEFRPERFLHEDGSLTDDDMHLAFGWGRRICAGLHLADASLWIAIASFLATFSVLKALDEHGNEIPIVPKFTTDIAIHPETFPCRVVPRFRGASVERLAQLTGLGSSVNSTCKF